MAKLKETLDMVFAKYIVKRDGKCITCGSTKDLQCGHFIHRAVLSLRYSEINCNAQCITCNQFLNGNEEVYEQKLILKWGSSIIDKLRHEKRNHLKMWTADYEDKIAYYKQKLKEFE